MLDLKLPWKKAVLKIPVDSLQMQLSETVRGGHLAVDSEGDLIMMAVVPVDTTLPKATAQGATHALPWVAGNTVTAAFPPAIVIHTAPAGMNCYMQGIQIDHKDATLAAAALAFIQVAGANIPHTTWGYSFWCDIAAVFRPSFVVSFGSTPLQMGGAVQIVNFQAFNAGGVTVQCWGYDA